MDINKIFRQTGIDVQFVKPKQTEPGKGVSGLLNSFMQQIPRATSQSGNITNAHKAINVAWGATLTVSAVAFCAACPPAVFIVGAKVIKTLIDEKTKAGKSEKTESKATPSEKPVIISEATTPKITASDQHKIDSIKEQIDKLLDEKTKNQISDIISNQPEGMERGIKINQIKIENVSLKKLENTANMLSKISDTIGITGSNYLEVDKKIFALREDIKSHIPKVKTQRNSEQQKISDILDNSRVQLDRKVKKTGLNTTLNFLETNQENLFLLIEKFGNPITLTDEKNQEITVKAIITSDDRPIGKDTITTSFKLLQSYLSETDKNFDTKSSAKAMTGIDQIFMMLTKLSKDQCKNITPEDKNYEIAIQNRDVLNNPENRKSEEGLKKMSDAIAFFASLPAPAKQG